MDIKEIPKQHRFHLNFRHTIFIQVPKVFLELIPRDHISVLRRRGWITTCALHRDQGGQPAREKGQTEDMIWVLSDLVGYL